MNTRTVPTREGGTPTMAGGRQETPSLQNRRRTTRKANLSSPKEESYRPQNGPHDLVRLGGEAKMKFYHVRRAENVKCGYCGGNTVFEFVDKGGRWKKLGSVSFGVQSNLAFLKMFRRLCTKCGKLSKIEYEIIETKS
jgi:hypothetical protein